MCFFLPSCFVIKKTCRLNTFSESKIDWKILAFISWKVVCGMLLKIDFWTNKRIIKTKRKLTLLIAIHTNESYTWYKKKQLLIIKRSTCRFSINTNTIIQKYKSVLINIGQVISNWILEFSNHIYLVKRTVIVVQSLRLYFWPIFLVFSFR